MRSWTAIALGLALLLAKAAWAETGADASGKRVSKAALAASYDPALVNGLPWYRGAEAVKLHNRRRGTAARPILFLRILGDLDGRT